MTLKEFGQKVKSKYPQYQDMDDEEVGQKVLAKYPQYQSQIDSGSSVVAEKNEKKTIVGMAGDFVKNIFVGVTKPLVQSVAQIPMAADMAVQKLSGKENVQAPTYNLPLYGEIKPPTSKEQIAGTALKTVSLGMGPVSGGAAFFGGSAMEENKSAKDVALSAAGGAAFGKATQLVSKGISKVPEGMWSALLKRTSTSVAKNPELEKQISKEGIVGMTKGGISKKLGLKIQESELQLSDLLSKNEGKISTIKVVDNLRSIYNHYSNIPGETEATNKILEIGNSLLDKGKTISVADANQLKRDIYGLVQNTYGKGLLEIPAKKEAQKAIARGLKQEIEKVVPEAKNINVKLAIYIQAQKAIDQRIARETGKGIAGTGIGLFDLMVGGGVGFARGPISGLQALVAKKIAESPAIQTTVASGSQKLVNMFESLSPTQQILFYNGLRGIVDGLMPKKTSKQK